MSLALTGLLRAAREVYGRELAFYDESFLLKSLEKRQTLAAAPTPGAYLELFGEDPVEAAAFFDSLIITYSEFFRGPLGFALLEQWVLPQINEDRKKRSRAEIRVWSAACASGQEAYSLAILLDGLGAGLAAPPPFRIFATDFSPAALAAARAGVYSADALQNVPLKHLNRCFTRQGELFTIAPWLREQVDFSFYDLLDPNSLCPPASVFGDFDLVVCSNVLFYYRADVRRFILNKINRALSPGGWLVTGEAEKAVVDKTDGFRALVFPAAVFQKQ